MKILLLFGLLVVCQLTRGQWLQARLNPDCGEWVKDSIYITEWTAEDTLKYNPDTVCNWLYSEWKESASDLIYPVYCPCGCGWDSKRYRNRICDVGIIQTQYEVTTYKYIAPPESEYDKKVRELMPKFGPVFHYTDTTSLIKFYTPPDTILFVKPIKIHRK